jgi:transcriptional regulator with XRE-family HTH domain
VRQVGSQKAAAEALGISQAYLSDLLNSRRNPSPAILDKLGLRETVVRQRP